MNIRSISSKMERLSIFALRQVASHVFSFHCRVNQRSLSFGRIRIIAVAICTLNSAVETMNHKFSFLVLADFASCINSFFFCGIITTCACCSAAFDIPSSIGIRNHMMTRS